MKRVTVTFEFDTSKQEKVFKTKLFEIAQNMKAKFKRYESKGVKSGNSGVFNSDADNALCSVKSV